MEKNKKKSGLNKYKVGQIAIRVLPFVALVMRFSVRS